MPIRVSSVSFEDDGALMVTWMKDEESSVNGVTYHQTVITEAARENFQQVGYYADEVTQDVHELIEWWIKSTR